MRDTIDMAHEAGLRDLGGRNMKALDAFAALVRADEREQIIAKNAPEIERLNAYIKELEDAVLIEREACAKVAERFEPSEKTSYVTYASQAIRARGNT